ncbi:MAG: hypothetical protein K6F52_00420 [Clostridia bacterium]|nr:hypothetical protein [Clostridia bacterium]
MFKLAKNLYTKNGRCIYEDDRQNSVFAKRTEDGFVIRLRFSDRNIKTKPLYISVPVKKQEEGSSLHVDYPSYIDYDAQIGSVIDDFTDLVNRWINMVYDMMILESHKGMDAGILSADIEKLKIYEEMEGVISAVDHSESIRNFD